MLDSVLSATQNSVSYGAQREVTSRTRLHGRRLLLARTAYVTLVILMLGLFVGGVPVQFRNLASGDAGLGITYTRTGEVLVSSVAPGLPADKAGIQVGDILLAIDGVPIAPWSSWTELNQRLSGPVGTQVSLDVRSEDGTTHQYTLTRDARSLVQGGIQPTTYALYLTVLDILLVLGFCIPALIIFWRKSDDWVGMFVSLVLVIVAVRWTGEDLAFISLYSYWSGMIVFVVLALLYKVSVLVLFYIFPDGQFVPQWTRKLVGVGVVWTFLAWLPWPYGLWHMLDLGLYATGLFAQVYRYRRVSSPQERQQTKWVVFGLAIAFFGVYGSLFLQLMFPMLQEPTPSNLFSQLVGLPLFYLALLMVPLTFTISILRYRLYDIDIIINRTLVYVPLTAIVAGLITASQRLFVTLTAEQSLTATVLSTLIVVALLTPIKDQMQKRVDRYFKEVPDPGKKLKLFAEQVRSRLFAVDVQQITRRLLEEAVMAFEAKSGAVYLMSDGDLKLIHATRAWDGEAQLSVPLQRSEGEAQFGLIALGARHNGAGYTARDRAVLQDVTQVVALAIEQDRQTE